MAYATYEDVEDLLGETMSTSEQTAMTIYLAIAAKIIDDKISSSGADPDAVATSDKKIVSQLIGQNAFYAIGVDPTLVNASFSTAGDSESFTRSSAALRRVFQWESLYSTLLGIKTPGIATINTSTSWRK